MSPGYVPRDVVRLTGLPYSTLNLWAKTGFICPSICAGVGTGSERIYSKDDIEDLKIAYALKCAGLGLKVIKQALEKFRNYPRAKRIEVQLSRHPQADIFISIQRPSI